MTVLIAVLLFGSVTDQIWYEKAYEAILTRNDFWEIPVRVENLHRDLFASTEEFSLEYCEGGIWVGEQILKIDYTDPHPRCPPGFPFEGCHYWGPCRDACDGAWGCRTEVWTCCWTPGFNPYLFDCQGGGGDYGPVCLYEEPS